MEVLYKGKQPTQGYERDFAYDVYTKEGALVVPQELTSVMVPLDLKTEFDADKYGLIVVPRSSMSKTPLIQGNHIGVVEGDYRGNWKMPMRNTVVLSGVKGTVLKLGEKGLENVPVSQIPKSVMKNGADHFAKDMDLLNMSLSDEMADHLFRDMLPSGTVYIPRGTRIAQAFALKKEPINWTAVKNFSDTDRGEGGFGSSGQK